MQYDLRSVMYVLSFLIQPKITFTVLSEWVPYARAPVSKKAKSRFFFIC
jgi:hypothetical protein